MVANILKLSRVLDMKFQAQIINADRFRNMQKYRYALYWILFALYVFTISPRSNTKVYDSVGNFIQFKINDDVSKYEFLLESEQHNAEFEDILNKLKKHGIRFVYRSI